MPEQPFTEEDVQLVADLLPLLVAQEHGCLPEECDKHLGRVTPENWRSIANSIVAALAEAGRLLPAGAHDRADEEFAVFRQTSSGFDVAAVVHLKQAKKYAAEFGGEVKGRLVTTVYGPWVPVGTEETPEHE